VDASSWSAPRLRGSPLRVAGRRFIVTGVLRPTGSDDDRLLIAELRAVQRLLGRPGELTLVEVAARPGASVTRLTGQLAAALPSARVVSLREAVQSRLHAVDQFRGFAYAIVAVILGIEGLVVFLTMSGAVAERTHEIGVFRALGFRSAHVTRLIVLEAAVAGLLAGVLGAAAGVLVAWLVLPAVSDGAQMTWSPLPGLAAVVASVLLGSAASLPPALRAGRLDPTEALRAL
jgi:putative ABC transport system permease protein